MRLRRTTGPLGSGARDQWVTIQARPEDPTGDSGFPTEGEWTTLATVAMARDDIDAREIARGAEERAIGTVRWELPYRADMDPDLVDVPKLRRLVYLARSFDILSATPIGRHRAIELYTEVHSKTPTEAAP